MSFALGRDYIDVMHEVAEIWTVRAVLLAVVLALPACRYVVPGCGKEPVVKLKVGGEKAEIRYQFGTKDVSLGKQDLPWSKTLHADCSITSVRVDVGYRGEGWCEILIDGEVCDHEDEGHWCSCYYDRKDGWSGWPNNDQSKATHIR